MSMSLESGHEGIPARRTRHLGLLEGEKALNKFDRSLPAAEQSSAARSILSIHPIQTSFRLLLSCIPVVLHPNHIINSNLRSESVSLTSML